MKQRILVFLVGWILVLGAGECIARWYLRDPDLGDRYRILKRAYFTEPLDPTASPPYRSNRVRRTADGGIVVVHGLHEERIWSREVADGTYRVLCIGDSTTEPWPEEGYRNWTDALRDLLTRNFDGGAVEVLALGTGGYNTWAEWSWYKRDLSDIEANLLLLQQSPDDCDLLEVRPPSLASRLLPYQWRNGQVWGRNRKVPDPPRPSSWLRSDLFWLLMHRIILRGDEGLALVGTDPRQDEALAGFRDEAGSQDLALRVVIFPDLGARGTDLRLNRLREAVARAGLPAIDLEPALREYALKEGLSPESLTQDSLHPDAATHTFIAQVVYERLVREGLVPGSRGDPP